MNPEDLSELFYFFCVRLSPEYIGQEINIGIELLLKSVAKANNVPKKVIKEAFLNLGDIGIVTE